ncbi:MAG: HEAT repeat domain-containing protein [Acidobacteriota bacterium]
MDNRYSLGLYRHIESEKENAFKFLNKTTRAMYQDLLCDLINCAYEIQNTEELKQSHLDLLYQGMRQRHEMVFSYYSGRFVSILSHGFPEAELLLKCLSDDRSAQIRFNAVTILLSRPCDSVIRYVVNKCATDKSSKVRRKVPDVCNRLNLINMLPILESQWIVEEDNAVKESLNYSIRLLRDGFVLLDNGTDKKTLLTKLPDGTIKGTTV